MKKNYLKIFALLLATMWGGIAYAYDFSDNGIYYNVDTIDGKMDAIVTFMDGNYNSYADSIMIPSRVKDYSVTGIGMNAFRNCSNLYAVDLPQSITHIDNGAFLGCSALKSIVIPDSTTIINNGAFSNCSQLSELQLGSLLQEIGQEAFSNCTSLVDITLPSSLMMLGQNAFNGTGWYNAQPDGELYIGAWNLGYKGTMPSDYNLNLKSGILRVSQDAFLGNENLSTVTLPEGLISIGFEAFEECSNLKSVMMPSTLTSIGYNAFSNCTSLESISLPDSVKVIEDGVFYGCSALTHVMLGSNVSVIRDYAFYNCPNLMEFHINSNIPPTCETYAISDIDKTKCKLFIPKNTAEAYKNADYWKDFTLVVDTSVSSVKTDEIQIFRDGDMITITGNNIPLPILVYNISGAIVYRGNEKSFNLPYMGVYIINIGKSSFKIVK